MKLASRWLQWGLAISLGLFFLLQGLSKLFGPASVQWAIRFVGWGYPGWFLHVVGVMEVASGLGCFIPHFRKPAAVGLMVVMAGALGTHILHREYLRVIPPLVLGGMAVLLFRSACKKPAAHAVKQSL
jgi:putative oxidoreductase